MKGIKTTITFMLITTVVFLDDKHTYASGKSYGGGLIADSKLSFEYIISENGGHFLKLLEIERRNKDGKALFKDLHTIELQLKSHESLSLYNDFYCVDSEGKEVLGVITNIEKVSCEETINPVRAWKFEIKEKKILPVQSPTQIYCSSTGLGRCH